jgi:signal peptidase
MQLTQWQSIQQVTITIFIIVFYLLFAPPQLGGITSVAIVNGNSMEPMMHRGDLAFAQPADTYQVGDVVIYRDPTMGPVIHRIYAKESELFVFKGDNNSSLDPYQAAHSDIIGKLWFFIPGVGDVLAFIRRPLHLAIGSGLIFGAFAMVQLNEGPRQRRHRKGKRPQRNKDNHPMGKIASFKDILVGTLILIAVAALGLGAFAFTQPETHAATDQIAYEQQGTFSYVAQDTQGIYDNGFVETGEPVFRKFTDAITTTFTYLCSCSTIQNVNGTYRLYAEVSDSSGWKRTAELQPTTAFTGTSFLVSRPVDLILLQGLIDKMEQPTGIQRKQYNVAVVAQVLVLGASGSTGWQDTFVPRMDFQLDETQLRLVGDAKLSQSQKGTLNVSRSEPNTLSLLSLHPKVQDTRLGAAIAFVIAAAGALGVFFFVPRSDPATQIQSRYSELLVSAMRIQHMPATIIDVMSIDDLVKLAEKDNRTVLHTIDAGGHHYYVQGEESLYHFCLGDPGTTIHMQQDA